MRSWFCLRFCLLPVLPGRAPAGQLRQELTRASAPAPTTPTAPPVYRRVVHAGLVCAHAANELHKKAGSKCQQHDGSDGIRKQALNAASCLLPTLIRYRSTLFLRRPRLSLAHLALPSLLLRALLRFFLLVPIGSISPSHLLVTPLRLGLGRCCAGSECPGVRTNERAHGIGAHGMRRARLP